MDVSLRGVPMRCDLCLRYLPRARGQRSTSAYVSYQPAPAEVRGRLGAGTSAPLPPTLGPAEAGRRGGVYSSLSRQRLRRLSPPPLSSLRPSISLSLHIRASASASPSASQPALPRGCIHTSVHTQRVDSHLAFTARLSVTTLTSAYVTSPEAQQRGGGPTSASSTLATRPQAEVTSANTS